MSKTLALLLTLSTVLPLAAQTEARRTQVYRCGPDGRDLRDSPCPAGSGHSTAVDFDEPSAADSRAARARHLADAKQAAALATARRASEAEARRQRGGYASLQTLPPAAQPASGPQVTSLQPPKTAKPRKPAATPGTGR